MVLNTSIDANIRNCLPLPSHRRKSPGKSMGKFSSIFSVFPSKQESFFLCRLLKSSPSFSSFTPPTRAAFSVFLRPHVLVNLDSTNAFNSQLPTKPSLSSSSPSSMSSSSSSVSSLESSSELYVLVKVQVNKEVEVDPGFSSVSQLPKCIGPLYPFDPQGPKYRPTTEIQKQSPKV